ncbi:MAG: glycoside hydrolase family 3 C-terminal domain-containing protein [Bacteroides sp]|nr:glycoside hydrolase family 3 C-terminal domain-containing protein [Bacteroides sp.]
MKKYTQAMALAGLMLVSCGQQQPKVEPAIPYDAEIERKVEETLGRMTLEEKIGQMTELNVDLVGKPGTHPFEVDEALLDTVIGKYKVGSILNAPYTAAPTKEQWKVIIDAIQKKSMEAIGIPCIYGLDMNHGVTYTQDGTLFPQNINVAATFNRELARRGAEITAYETRASNTPWTYSPTLDLVRNPLWPRVWENFGEDPYMNAEMGKAMVLGFQGEDPNHIDKNHIATSVKHYMGYGASVSGKDRTPAIISPADLREKHFAPYLAAVRQGALTIMANSGTINGMPVHANYELLTKWLKEDLNWDGMIVTDWADIDNLWKREKVAKDKKEAIKIAINAGIDMSMDPYDLGYCRLLKELVDEGQVPMSRIDDATRRVLRLKYRLGLFDQPTTDYKDYPEFGGSAHAKAALQSATESMILLKNESDVLPLAKGKKILLTGPNANQMRCLNGGWSYTWQGHLADQFAGAYNTIYEAMCNEFGASNVILEQGVTYNEKGNFWEENTPQIQKAVAAAARADVIVACIGENSYCETPGNLPDLTLSQNQRDLVKALAKTGKPVVLVLNGGRPRIIADIEPLAKSVVNILLPGNYGGDALANLLSGDDNFSGKMPYTYPKEVNSLINYDYKNAEHIGEAMEGAYNYDAQVSFQWAFGYGLSYNDYEYSNFKVNKSDFTADDELVFTVDVKNTGNRVGKESVLLFSSDLIASLTPDNRRLRQFEKVELQPGETKTVTLKLKGSDLAFVGYDGKWRLEEGEFRMQTGNQVLKVNCAATKVWNTPNKD